MIQFGGKRRWYWFWVPRQWPGKIKLLIFIVLVLTILLANRIFYVIPAGRVGVLFSPFYGGTRTDIVLNEGLQVIWPWKNVYIYDHRVQSREIQMTPLVESSMQVSVHVVVYFQLVHKSIPFLHKEFGENYVTMLIDPLVRSELREVLGRIPFDMARDTDNSELEQAVVAQLNEAAGRHVVEDRDAQESHVLVEFKRVAIRALSIPDAVSQAVNWKEQQRQYLLAAQLLLERARIEAQQRQVEAEGVAAANRTINATLTPGILTWRNIEAIEAISKSGNARVVILGNNGKDTPVIIGSDVLGNSPASNAAPPSSSEPTPPPFSFSTFPSPARPTLGGAMPSAKVPTILEHGGTTRTGEQQPGAPGEVGPQTTPPAAGSPRRRVPIVKGAPEPNTTEPGATAPPADLDRP